MFDPTPLTSGLARIPAVRLVVLFGSTAAGRGRPDSDVDLAVELDPDDASARAAVIATVTSQVAGPVDIVFVNDAGPQLRFEIARGGQLLHQRDARDWERMKARAMIDWWDWQPTSRAMHRGLLARLRASQVDRHGP